jgi:hypothetical protein
MDIELPLFLTILQPVEPHVNGLAPFLLYSTRQDTFRSLVIRPHWGSWLAMP